jgi:hypothetical protein
MLKRGTLSCDNMMKRFRLFRLEAGSRVPRKQQAPVQLKPGARCEGISLMLLSLQHDGQLRATVAAIWRAPLDEKTVGKYSFFAWDVGFVSVFELPYKYAT